jgi:hypothetical protein
MLLLFRQLMFEYFYINIHFLLLTSHEILILTVQRGH